MLIESSQASIPLYQQTFNESVRKLDSFLDTTTHLIFSITQFIVAVIILILVFRIIIWMSKEDEKIVISPFDIQTYTKTYNGKIISDSLILEVYRIGKIHRTDYAGISSERIVLPKVTPNSECLETKISSLGEISIGGIKIPGGELAAVFKQLWPFGGTGKRITGSLQECESGIRLTAQMEGYEIFFWDTKRERTQTDSEDQIISRIQDLAFMMVFDLSKEKTKAKTWTGLKYFTEALEAYSRYTKNQQLEDLEIASKKCIEAERSEHDYQLLSSLFYNLGIAYFNIEEFKFSKELFEHYIELEKDNESAFIGLGASLSSLDQHEEALKAYDRALKINPDNAIALINKGKSLFLLGKTEDALNIYDKVLGTNPEDKDALYDRACIYCRKGEIKEALDDLKSAIEEDQKWKEIAKNDEDFRKLYENELFKKLVK
jgi:tetratricopeptide (TPR) repeat protein